MAVTFLTWLVGFVAVFAANALFHTFVAARFYDPHLGGVTLPMAQANPVLIALVDVVLVAAMAYFILRTGGQPTHWAEAAKTGAMIGLIGSWTYNLVNYALIPAWPVAGSMLDVFWHVILGAAGGVLMAAVYNRLSARLQARH